MENEVGLLSIPNYRTILLRCLFAILTEIDNSFDFRDRVLQLVTYNFKYRYFFS